MSKCVIIANKCTKVDGAVVLLNMPYNAGFQGKTQVFLIRFSIVLQIQNMHNEHVNNCLVHVAVALTQSQ
jgi:hypothetical protein